MDDSQSLSERFGVKMGARAPILTPKAEYNHEFDFSAWPDKTSGTTWLIEGWLDF